jgi:hypothetical protein
MLDVMGQIGETPLAFCFTAADRVDYGAGREKERHQRIA